MKHAHRIVTGIALVCAISGCRAGGRVIEEPRADFDVPPDGNRGYLVGTPPALADDRKPTRQMVEAEFETPPLRRGKGTAPAELEGVAPPEVDLSDSSSDEETAEESSAAGPLTTYVVQKGETLWSIAAKPEVFGDATKWRRLYRMNHDLLGSPDHLRAGMTIKIPQVGQGAAAATASSEPATTFTPPQGAGFTK